MNAKFLNLRKNDIMINHLTELPDFVLPKLKLLENTVMSFIDPNSFQKSVKNSILWLEMVVFLDFLAQTWLKAALATLSGEIPGMLATSLRYGFSLRKLILVPIIVKLSDNKNQSSTKYGFIAL